MASSASNGVVFAVIYVLAFILGFVIGALLDVGGRNRLFSGIIYGLLVAAFAFFFWQWCSFLFLGGINSNYEWLYWIFYTISVVGLLVALVVITFRHHQKAVTQIVQEPYKSS